MSNCPTSPSSGQATTSSQLRDPILLACHSGAAFDRLVQDREVVMARRRQGGDVTLVAADPLERLPEFLEVYGC